MRARRDKNQDRIAIARFLHSQLKKSSLCPRQSIILKFSSLNKNADLARRSPLRFFDCLGYPVVIEPAKKVVGAHLPTAARAASAEAATARTEAPEPAAGRPARPTAAASPI